MGLSLRIGKAKKLKSRVNSYLQKPHKKLQNVSFSGSNKQIEIIVCEPKEHASSLENQLIKYFKLKYNILLKDDKSFPYIRLSKKCIHV